MLVAVLMPAFVAFPQERPKPVTVPITLDHNRIVIDVYLPLSDGTSKRVRAWVDTGNSDMMMSQRIASLFGSVNCDDKVCNATPPSEVVIKVKIDRCDLVIDCTGSDEVARQLEAYSWAEEKLFFLSISGSRRTENVLLLALWAVQFSRALRATLSVADARAGRKSGS